MTIRLIALFLSLSVSALSDDSDYADDQEQACSFGGMKYLCENFEICSQFGLIDEDAKNVLCGAYLDELNYSPSEGPSPIFTPETRFQNEQPTQDTESPSPIYTPEIRFQTEEPTSKTGFPTTRLFSTYFNGVTTGESHSSPQTTQSLDVFSTFHYTAEAEVDPTVDPEVVRQPPVITIAPVNITVAPGETVRFDCEAKAAMTPQITLTKKDQLSRPNLESFNGYSGGQVSQTTVNSMTIDHVEEPNEGWYTCLACNRYGCDEQDAYLTVLDLCEGVTCPGEKQCVGNYAAGHGYTCECPSFCDTADLFVSDFVCSNYCEELFNECLMKEDACRNEKFGVEVLNKGRCGQIQHPEIVEEEFTYGAFRLEAGDELVLECNAIGFPEPQIVWYRDEEIVGHGNYLMKSVSVADGGEYTCEAVNCMTTKVSKILAAVEVTGTPDITVTKPSSVDDIHVDTPRATCAVSLSLIISN